MENIFYEILNVHHTKALETVENWISKHPQDVNWVNDAGYSILVLAILEGFEDVARYLVDQGADLTRESGTDAISPAEAASSKDISPELYEYILQKSIGGINLKARMLWRVISQPEKLEIALKYGLNFHMLFPENKSVLQYLIEMSFTNQGKDIETLLNYDIDLNINQQDNKGNTALMSAVSMFQQGNAAFFLPSLGNDEVKTIVDKIMSKKPDLTFTNNDGKNVFSLAAESGLYSYMKKYLPQMSEEERDMYHSVRLKNLILNEEE